MSPASKTPTDLDLMLYADGELAADEERAVEKYLDANPDARIKLESLGQVGEVIRTHSEIETDAIEQTAAFGQLWDRIERRIHANGVSKHAETGPGEDRPLRVPEREASAGLWQSIRRWFSEHRGHVVTGLVGAGAAAALMMAVGPREKIIERHTVEVPTGTAQPAVMPVVDLESEPPEVEDLEVYEGTGTILTIEGEGEDDSSATVIWISDDEQENMEDPI